MPPEQTITTQSGQNQEKPCEPFKPDQPLSLRNVLMAMDFSECSGRALEYALGIAARYEAQLYLFHCVDPTPYNTVTPDAVQTACEAAQRDMERLGADLRSRGLTKNVEVKLRVESGDMAEILPRIVRELDLGLIVVGTHGRTGWRKLVLGSVAEIVVEQASCPVLTVGPGADRKRIQEFGPENVLFANDPAVHSKLAESCAFSLARKYGSRLTVVDVLEDRSGRVRARVSQIERLERDWHVPELKDGRFNTEASPQWPSDLGTRSNLVLRFADHFTADLIVLTAPASHRLTDRFMSSNTYQVVCGARCPVLTVRAE